MTPPDAFDLFRDGLDQRYAPKQEVLHTLLDQAAAIERLENDLKELREFLDAPEYQPSWTTSAPVSPPSMTDQEDSK